VLFATRGTQAPAQQPVAEQEPARLVTGNSSSAVQFGDVHVTADADSAIDMEQNNTVALLEHGAAWFSVAPRGDRPAFEVRAGDAIVRVVGTRFRVSRDGEHVDVAVDHGAVEVRFRGRVIRLSDGQTWSSQPQPDIEMDPPAPVSHSGRRK
jgi:transmembrane sensor